MIERSQFEQLGQEIVGALAERMRPRGLMLSDFPRLTDDGHTRRLHAVMAGRGKGAVNLPSVLKSFARRAFPDFEFHARSGDYHEFQKELADDLKLVLIFERIHHYGLGKAFTVHLGCEQAGASGKFRRWTHSLFPFFDREQLEWTYGLRDELEACLKEAGTLLAMILPEYGAAWLTLRSPEHSEILDALPERGALSFHEAADVAYQSLLSGCRQFGRVTGAWFRPMNSLYSRFNDTHGPDSAALSGRLSPGHSWHIRFADVATNRTVTVSVPCRGRLAFVLSNSMSINRDGVHHSVRAASNPQEALMLPLAPDSFEGGHRVGSDASWRRFADSPGIMEIAAASGGQAFLTKNPNCGVVLQLDAEISEPPLDMEHWYVRYSRRAERGMQDLHLTISARDRRVTWRQPA